MPAAVHMFPMLEMTPRVDPARLSGRELATELLELQRLAPGAASGGVALRLSRLRREAVGRVLRAVMAQKPVAPPSRPEDAPRDRKSTRLNSSPSQTSDAV